MTQAGRDDEEMEILKQRAKAKAAEKRNENEFHTPPFDSFLI